ncbi:MAG: peptidylprolyl isomerase [Spirochaetota bacterium]|nr:peptidylprolyl isomerase [Spirochaetota bacterium]
MQGQNKSNNWKIFLTGAIVISSLLFVVLTGIGAASGDRTAVIETNRGTIRISLALKDAPITAGNFIKLVESGFYNGLTFHRVEPRFVVQGGDPRGDGTGGAGKEIKLEIKCKDGRIIVGRIAPRNCVPVLRHRVGVLSMARANEPNSASSQFFIVIGKASFLDRKYAAFGRVIEGMDVVNSLRVGDKMVKVEME